MTRFGCLLVAALLGLAACGPSTEPAGPATVTVNPDTPFDPTAGPEPAQDTADDPPPVDAGADPPADAGAPPEADAPPADRLVLGNRDRRQFGDVTVGESVTRSFTAFVTSADPTAPVTATVSGSDAFAIREPECAGAGTQRECRIRVTFAPLRPGPKAADLVVTLAGAEPKSLALTGAGAPPVVDPSPEPPEPSPSAEAAAAAAARATTPVATHTP